MWILEKKNPEDRFKFQHSHLIETVMLPSHKHVPHDTMNVFSGVSFIGFFWHIPFLYRDVSPNKAKVTVTGLDHTINYRPQYIQSDTQLICCSCQISRKVLLQAVLLCCNFETFDNTKRYFFFFTRKILFLASLRKQ